MSLTYASACSGIEAATVAWHPLGWRPIWFSEIEPFPCRVLKHHYPYVPNLGNLLELETNKTFLDAALDLLVAGTPCQSFSLAGLRAGLADLRGNLSLAFCRLLRRKRPPWFVWENVPGVLSSFSGEAEDGVPVWQTSDFATLLRALQDCGYSVAWRVLDSQFFGVPQRRSRVFVVGYLGNDWRPPAAVLFEPEIGRGDPTQSRASGEIVAALTSSSVDTCGPDDNQAQAGHIVPCWWDGGQVSQTLDAVLNKGQTMPEKNRFPAVLTPRYFEPRVARNGRGGLDDVAAPLKAHSGGTGKGDGAGMIIYPMAQITSPTNGSNPVRDDPSPTLTGKASDMLLIPTVRRLTPLECERLQGFPDGYTALPGAKDAPRYKALGNSMTTQVMGWIGRRIDLVDKLLKHNTI